MILGVNGVTGRAIALDLAAVGWDVAGTGRDAGRFPHELRDIGVTFVRSERRDEGQLASVLSEGADVVIDCVCYTAEDARALMTLRRDFGSAVVLSSKAVYVDDRGRHSNSDEAPGFGGPVTEMQAVLEPDFSGDYRSREGYGANKVAAETVLQDADVPVSILRPSRIHGTGADPAREWFVVKRLLDGRRQIPLAHGGLTGNHPTAATNLARLVRLCAERPGDRILNAADPGSPTARDVVLAIAAATGIQAEVVPLGDDAPPQFGASPWDTWPPFFLDTSAAAQLGFEAVGTYAATVSATVSDLLRLARRQQDALSASEYFADVFGYALDDAALAWNEQHPAG